MAHLWWLSRTEGAHDRRWVEALTRGGHRVTALLTTDGADALRRRAAADPVDLVLAGPLTDALPLAVEVAAAPVVGMAWAFDLMAETADPEVAARMRAALPAARWVHVDAEHLRGVLVGEGVPGDRVSVAPWGIDVDRFTPGHRSPALRARVGAGAEDVVVLTTRSWEPVYAVDVVLEGFARARRQDPRLRLAWGGDGSQREQLRAVVRGSDASAAVVELGRLAPADVQAWLRSCDVYVSAARTDGSSLSLLEALACGVPALVTDLPTNAEWVDDPVVGRRSASDDPAALCDALLELAASLPGPPAGVARRRRLVLERGDWRVNQQVLLAAVARVLEERSA